MQSKRRVVLTKVELDQLWDILSDFDRSHKFKDLQKPTNHRRLWLKCSGALGQKISNPGYYASLKQCGINYPNPSFYQIDKDLERTFPHIQNKDELAKYTVPLRHVLRAFILRNPCVGYFQGMNFVAARLLTCMNEEESFWTLTQIMECYLPPDYYMDVLGVLTD